MASLNESFFRTEAGKESYSYIMHSLNQRGVTPAFSLMLETAKLSTPTKEFLRDCENSPKTTDHAHQIVSTLNDYRRAFLFYENAREILTELENKKMDLDGLTAKSLDTLTAVQTGRDSADCVFHFGADANAEELVHKILYNEDADQIIPSGYKAWDDVNGGFPRGSLVILAGSTGAGKSHNALQLSVNAAKAGYKSTLVPLEMTEEAMTGRWLANISGVDSLKILLKQLATDEKAFIAEKAKRWNRGVARRGGRLTIFKPGSDVTLEALMASVHSYNGDIVIIDYISLLSGADGDDQWRKLGSMARYAARYADVHRKVVVLLAQVDEQDKIRYAKSIKEHAAIMWSFVATKETKEQGLLKYNVQKARLQDSRGFSMHIDYSLSRITDFTTQEDQRTATQTADGTTTPRRKSRSMKDNNDNEDTGMMPDLTEDAE
jgi:archaellum biogenesis ATPase FlaH